MQQQRIDRPEVVGPEFQSFSEHPTEQRLRAMGMLSDPIREAIDEYIAEEAAKLLPAESEVAEEKEPARAA